MSPLRVLFLLLVSVMFLAPASAWADALLDGALIEAVHREDEALALEILEQGASPNARASCGLGDSQHNETVLNEAIKHKWRRLFEALLARGADVKARGEFGKTALHVIGFEDGAWYLDALLARGADVNARDDSGQTPLHSVYRGEPVRKLLEHGADIRAVDKYGNTPLHRAADVHYRPDKVRELMAWGMDAQAKNKAGQTPLEIALGWTYSASCVALLEGGARLTDRNLSLHLAAAKGETGKIKLLVRGGLPVDGRDKDGGGTALLWAVGAGQDESARTLLALDADPLAPGRYGFTPLHSALQGNNTRTMRLLLDAVQDPNAKPRDRPLLLSVADTGRADLVRSLLDRGADPRARPAEGETALHRAAAKGGAELIRMLVEAGLDPNTEDHKQQTALHVAASNGNAGGVLALIQAGAKLEVADAEGYSPFLLAAKMGQEAVLNVLLDHGADIRARDLRGGTALTLAAGHGGRYEHDHSGAVRLLLSRGADPWVYHDRKNFLQIAVERNWTDLAARLLDQGGDVNQRDENGNSLLAAALRCRAEESMDLLLERGARVVIGQTDFVDSREIALPRSKVLLRRLEAAGLNILEGPGLHQASALNVLALLEAGADIEEKDQYGQTPLIWAADNECDCLALGLLDRGADINAQDQHGWTPLIHAMNVRYARRGRSSALAKALIARGADVNLGNPLASATDRVDVANLLLAKGADPNANGGEPLWRAAADRKTDLLRRMLKAGGDPNIRNVYGDTPLYWALGWRRPSLDVARVLARAGADLNVCQTSRPLHPLMAVDDPKDLAALIKMGASLEGCGGGQDRPLHEAVETGKAKKVELLIKLGASLEGQGRGGATPLIRAVLRRDKDMVRLLLAKGAKVNGQDKDGRTALHLVSNRGDRDLFDLLLSRGADPNIRDKDGDSVLRLAIKGRNTDLARILLPKAVDLETRAKDGSNLLEDAQRWDPDLLPDLLVRVTPQAAKGEEGETALRAAAGMCLGDQARALLAKGAGAAPMGKDGVTALHKDAEFGCIEVAGLLLDAGAQVNALDATGATPLDLAARANGDHYKQTADLLAARGGKPGDSMRPSPRPLIEATGKGDVQAMRALLDQGADPNGALKPRDLRPLHAAVESGKTEAVRELLARGADPNLATKDGFTPLGLAIQKGHLVEVWVYERPGMCENPGAGNASAGNVSAPRAARGWTREFFTPEKWAETVHREGLKASPARSAQGLPVAVRVFREVCPGGRNATGPLHFVRTLAQGTPLEMLQTLVQAKADVNATQEKGKSALHLACRAGWEEAVGFLLAAGTDVNAQDSAGDTPLHDTAIMKRLALAKILLEAGANATARNKAGVEPIHAACMGSSMPDMDTRPDQPEVARRAFIELLFRSGADARAKDDAGTTPLHLSATLGDQDSARVLLAAGAEINAAEKWGLTPMHSAAYVGADQMILFLAQAGADVNLRDSKGLSPILHAAFRGKTQAIKALASVGADLNGRFARGMTPLVFSLASKQPASAMALLDAGADPAREDGEGRTPLCLALETKDKDMVKTLVERGADVNQACATTWSTKGHAPIAWAIAWGNESVFRYFLVKGAKLGENSYYSLEALCKDKGIGLLRTWLDFDPGVKDEKAWSGALGAALSVCSPEALNLLVGHGVTVNPESKLAGRETPLHNAAERCPRLVPALIQAGAQVNAKDSGGKTPLHRAAHRGSLEAVKTLLAHNASVSVRDTRLETVLHAAAFGGNVEVIRALIKAGAEVNAPDWMGHTPLDETKEWKRPEAAAELQRHGGVKGKRH